MQVEFVIRRTEGDPFDFALARDRFAAVLRPNSVPSHPIAGWGSHRIAIPTGTIIFSEEFVGFQVIVEGLAISVAEAAHLVQEICDNIISETGQAAEVV